MDNYKLILVKDKYQKEEVKYIIQNYHSYVPTYKSVGRKIDWLIYYNCEVVGMIGIGSATYPPCKDILEFLGIDKEEYKRQFNCFANNWRFCLIKTVKNLGTQVLKEMRNQAKKEWKRQYGNTLKYLTTFVGGNCSGSVYKADNWKLIGRTSGLPTHKSVSMKWNTNQELKNLFVKPDGQNKKLIFIKTLIPESKN